MNAKEYLIHELEYPEWLVNDTSSFYDTICGMMEEYHTLKSQEEAEERYKKAHVELFGHEPLEELKDNSDTFGILKALRIASGKEKR
jgi:hypothetical protein